MEVIQDYPQDKESYGLIKDNLLFNPYFKKATIISNFMIR
jgi:hypothetical protein